MNASDTIAVKLQAIGLQPGEAKIYLELLKGPSTHLKLASATNINRTKVYRLVADLEKRSLVSRRADDRGTFLVAADPSTLEVELVNQEEEMREKRQALKGLIPVLDGLKSGDSSIFVVHTYEGTEGFKQMLWHELKAKGENLIFADGSLEDLVPNRRWTEKHRAMTIEADYRLRELLNPGSKEGAFTAHKAFMTKYESRYISKETLPLDIQIAIYNDTVAFYHWRKEQKVGLEIISKTYADMMRHVFEHYWHLAGDKPA